MFMLTYLNCKTSSGKLLEKIQYMFLVTWTFRHVKFTWTVSRLDYGSATLASFPSCQLDRLPLVLNAETHLIYRSSKFDHVTPLLHDLHWLRILERIMFRLAVWRTTVTIDFHHSTLLMTFTRWRRSSHGDGCVRRRLQHWSPQPRRVLRSAIILSLSLPLVVTSSASLPVFRKHMKTVLFTCPFPL